eukprot:SAG11_NODE_15765_length_567_cov_0.764957_1_plen_98_part_10
MVEWEFTVHHERIVFSAIFLVVRAKAVASGKLTETIVIVKDAIVDGGFRGAVRLIWDNAHPPGVVKHISLRIICKGESNVQAPTTVKRLSETPAILP